MRYGQDSPMNPLWVDPSQGTAIARSGATKRLWSGNYENDVMAMFAFAARRFGAWISVASFAEICNIPNDTVRRYLNGKIGRISQIAEFYRYDYRVRMARGGGTFAYQMSAVYRGYG